MITEKQVRDVIRNVRENYDADALPIDEDFAEAGLDSLDHASILLELQGETGIVFPEGIEDQLNSIQAILDYSAKQSG